MTYKLPEYEGFAKEFDQYGLIPTTLLLISRKSEP